MVNGSRYYRALESVSIASALSTVLTIYTHTRPESINADSLNSNFLQLGRRSGGRSQRTVHPRRLPINTVIHTTLVGLEPTTFRLLVRRATNSATDSRNSSPVVISLTAYWLHHRSLALGFKIRDSCITETPFSTVTIWAVLSV